MRERESGSCAKVECEEAEFCPRLHPQDLTTPPQSSLINTRGGVAVFGFKVGDAEIPNFRNVIKCLFVIASGRGLGVETDQSDDTKDKENVFAVFLV